MKRIRNVLAFLLMLLMASTSWAAGEEELPMEIPEQIIEREKEVLIHAKTREIAIATLKAEGKLDIDGNIVKIII